MLTPKRALSLNITGGRPLPRVSELEALNATTTPRYGEVMMIAGRSGSQKSGFALWYVDRLDVPALYFSADMSPFTASSRVASTRFGLTTEEIEGIVGSGLEVERELNAALEGSKIQFSFGQPIRERQIYDELDAWVELHDAFPDVLVFDNLMDCEGAESDYSAQMAWMQFLTGMARDTGSALIVMHHASDKSWDSKTNPFYPPSRAEVKGGLSEKPALSLSVALDPDTMDFRIATIKQRMGAQDPTARRFVTMRCEPELTRFHSKGIRRASA